MNKQYFTSNVKKSFILCGNYTHYQQSSEIAKEYFRCFDFGKEGCMAYLVLHVGYNIFKLFFI